MNRMAASLIVQSPMLAKLYLHKLETEHYAENFTQTGVSAISMQYVDKLAQLCEEKQVNLHLLAVPLPDNEISRYAVDNAVEQTKGTSVESLIAELCSTVVYCDETLFLDGQHFDLEQVDAKEVITWIQQENNDLMDLKLGAE
jgi:hypothetical protein